MLEVTDGQIKTEATGHGHYQQRLIWEAEAKYYELRSMENTEKEDRGADEVNAERTTSNWGGGGVSGHKNQDPLRNTLATAKKEKTPRFIRTNPGKTALKGQISEWCPGGGDRLMKIGVLGDVHKNGTQRRKSTNRGNRWLMKKLQDQPR